jgi:hypothetical protein
MAHQWGAGHVSAIKRLLRDSPVLAKMKFGSVAAPMLVEENEFR